MTGFSSATLRRLDRFTAIAVTGPDAKSFLQGQLSFDLDRLGPARAQIAACSSAQGRVQAVLWLVERSDAIVLIVPTSMAEMTLMRLRKYVLRAKAKLECSDRFAIFEARDADPAGDTGTHREAGARSYVHWPGSRVLCIAPKDTSCADEIAGLAWQRADIAAGLPQVYPQTYETFVAQMLNLDVLGAISFEKGCYTGQEIIARMHFRGAVKRRMLRFRCAGSAPDPGARIVVDGQHAGDVVDAAATEQGSELLAVINLSQADAPLRIDAGAALEKLSLPYEV